MKANPEYIIIHFKRKLFRKEIQEIQKDIFDYIKNKPKKERIYGLYVIQLEIITQLIDKGDTKSIKIKIRNQNYIEELEESILLSVEKIQSLKNNIDFIDKQYRST